MSCFGVLCENLLGVIGRTCPNLREKVARHVARISFRILQMRSINKWECCGPGRSPITSSRRSRFSGALAMHNSGHCSRSCRGELNKWWWLVSSLAKADKKRFLCKYFTHDLISHSPSRWNCCHRKKSEKHSINGNVRSDRFIMKVKVSRNHPLIFFSRSWWNSFRDLQAVFCYFFKSGIALNASRWSPIDYALNRSSPVWCALTDLLWDNKNSSHKFSGPQPEIYAKVKKSRFYLNYINGCGWQMDFSTFATKHKLKSN